MKIAIWKTESFQHYRWCWAITQDGFEIARGFSHYRRHAQLIADSALMTLWGRRTGQTRKKQTK